VGGGQPRPLTGTDGAVDVAVSRTGHRLVYSRETSDLDIWRLDLQPRAATGDARTPFSVWKVPSSAEEAGNARRVTRGGRGRTDRVDRRTRVLREKYGGHAGSADRHLEDSRRGGDEEVVVEEFHSSHGSWDLTAEGLYFVDQEPSASGTSFVATITVAVALAAAPYPHSPSTAPSSAPWLTSPALLFPAPR
jgi:hypothetical protein